MSHTFWESARAHGLIYALAGMFPLVPLQRLAREFAVLARYFRRQTQLIILMAWRDTDAREHL